MLLDAGLVFLSDSRTNAGVDQINTFRKTTVVERARGRQPAQLPQPVRGIVLRGQREVIPRGRYKHR